MKDMKTEFKKLNDNMGDVVQDAKQSHKRYLECEEECIITLMMTLLL